MFTNYHFNLTEKSIVHLWLISLCQFLFWSAHNRWFLLLLHRILSWMLSYYTSCSLCQSMLEEHCDDQDSFSFFYLDSKMKKFSHLYFTLIRLKNLQINFFDLFVKRLILKLCKAKHNIAFHPFNSTCKISENIFLNDKDQYF